MNVLYKSSRYYQRPGKFATRGEDCAGGEWSGLVKVSITSRQECAGLAYYMYLSMLQKHATLTFQVPM